MWSSPGDGQLLLDEMIAFHTGAGRIKWAATSDRFLFFAGLLFVVFIVRMSAALSVLDDIINTHTRHAPLSRLSTSTVLCSVLFDVLKMIILLCMISFRRSNGIGGECSPDGGKAFPSH